MNHALIEDARAQLIHAGAGFIRAVTSLRWPLISDVPTWHLHYDRDEYRDDLFDALQIPFPHASLDRAVAKRRADYLAGRCAARLALAQLGLISAVPTGERGVPLWPHGVAGSITHSGTWSVACAARTECADAVGVDAETWIAPSTASEIANTILRTDETLCVIDLDQSRALTLAFSCKESLFKALFPHTGVFFDFHAARLLDIDERAGRFRIALTQDWSATLRAGKVFEGRYISDQIGVTSLICALLAGN